MPAVFFGGHLFAIRTAFKKEGALIFSFFSQIFTAGAIGHLLSQFF
jgi:hypothetical protein